MAKRGGKRRDPAREKFWRRTIRRQQRSGLTVRDFCGREGLKDWTFRWWRQELVRRDRQTAAALEVERRQVFTELRSDIGRLAVDLAERIVGESLADDDRQRRVVDSFIAGLENAPAAAGAGESR